MAVREDPTSRTCSYCLRVLMTSYQVNNNTTNIAMWLHCNFQWMSYFMQDIFKMLREFPPHLKPCIPVILKLFGRVNSNSNSNANIYFNDDNQLGQRIPQQRKTFADSRLLFCEPSKKVEEFFKRCLLPVHFGRQARLVFAQNKFFWKTTAAAKKKDRLRANLWSNSFFEAFCVFQSDNNGK